MEGNGNGNQAGDPLCAGAETLGQQVVASVPSSLALGKGVARMPAMLLAALHAMRPHQWVKNLFVLAPLLFARHLLVFSEALRSLGGLAAFCLASSAIYVFNDIHDLEQDRQHPTKRHRPIASGALPLQQAWWLFWALLAASLALGFLLAWPFGLLVAGFFVLNVAYTLKLKRMVFLDVLSIAASFILRVVGGGLVIQIHLSGWLLLCTFLLATFLGLGKRKHELISARESATRQRSVLAAYRQESLDILLILIATATMAAYIFYTMAETTMIAFSGQRLQYTIPSIMFGILRFLQLVERPREATSPTEAMIRDPLFVLNMLVWTAMVVAFLYLPGGG